MHTYKLYVQHILQPLHQEVLHWENGSARGKHHLPNHCLLLCRSSGMCEHTVQMPKHPLPRSHYNMAAARGAEIHTEISVSWHPFRSGEGAYRVGQLRQMHQEHQGSPEGPAGLVGQGSQTCQEDRRYQERREARVGQGYH
jgi:hypothetical protein